MSSVPFAFRASKAIQATAAPPIPQAFTWAASYLATPERPLLDMSQGVPGIPPPQVVLENLKATSSDPRTCGYTAVPGEVQLRNALADEMRVVYGGDSDITVDDIVLTAGCNMAFVAAVIALADAGDEVILPTPWYFNHQMTLSMLGITAKVLQTHAKDGFLPTVEDCTKMITPKTKAIALVTPNNPTGAVYPPGLLSAFGKVAREHNIALILDETYRDFVLSGPPHQLFSCNSGQNWRENLIHLFSFSKSYCLPGHRLGAVIASPAFLQHVCTVLDCIQICAPRPAQLALYPVLPQLRSFIRELAQSIASRHELFRSHLPSNWQIGSQGGFYAFVRHPFIGISSIEVSKRLASEMGVVTLPGEFFTPESGLESSFGEDEGWIRFAVANVTDEAVKLVCVRLAESESVFGWKLRS